MAERSAKRAKRGASGAGFWSGLILGVAIGAMAALIFAPPRRAADAPDAATDGQPQPPEIIGRLRERYSDALTLGREAYRQARGEVLATYNRAKADH